MFSFGDAQKEFSIQSCVKPLMYAIACEENGVDRVREYVGIEPSGLAFNEVRHRQGVKNGIMKWSAGSISPFLFYFSLLFSAFVS